MTTKSYSVTRTGLVYYTGGHTGMTYAQVRNQSSSNGSIGASQALETHYGSYEIGREVLIVDTSSDPLPVGAVITAAYFTFTRAYSTVAVPADDPYYDIVSVAGLGIHNPAIASDFGLLINANTVHCTKRMLDITYLSTLVMILPAAGIAELNINGVTLFGARNSGELNNVEPTGQSSVTYDAFMEIGRASCRERV